MPKYFIKEGGAPFKEVAPDEYEKTALEAHFNNFHHSVPVRVITKFGERIVHKEIIGQICDTQEQVEALLSGQRPEATK
jgi:hypothetical protein